MWISFIFIYIYIYIYRHSPPPPPLFFICSSKSQQGKESLSRGFWLNKHRQAQTHLGFLGFLDLWGKRFAFLVVGIGGWWPFRRSCIQKILGFLWAAHRNGLIMVAVGLMALASIFSSINSSTCNSCRASRSRFRAREIIRTSSLTTVWWVRHWRTAQIMDLLKA